MRTHYATLVVSTLLVSTALSIGCATRMQLRYAEPPTKEPTRGEISVVLEDQRLANQGGEDPLRVGSVRNAFGMPFPLMAASDREPTRVSKQLVSDCLKGTGYRVVEPSEGVPQLHAALLTFWTDGFQNSRVVVEMDLRLRDGKGVPTAWRHLLVSNTGVTWTAGYGPFDAGFTKTLDLAKMMLIAELNRQPFKDAYASVH